jgi:hypothetical protein
VFHKSLREIEEFFTKIQQRLEGGIVSKISEILRRESINVIKGSGVSNESPYKLKKASLIFYKDLDLLSE